MRAGKHSVDGLPALRLHSMFYSHHAGTMHTPHPLPPARLVAPFAPLAVPGHSPLADKSGLLYWQWAFEAPLSFKAIVRREMGEENTPQVGGRVQLGGSSCSG